MSRRFPVLAPLLASLAVALALPASAAKDEGPERSSVGEIVKRHNQPIPGGRLALRLDVPTTVVGHAGSTVTCVVFFADEDGRYVPSVLQEYAGPDGSIRLLGKDATVASDSESVPFAFTLPYEAFPRRSARYRVEARARLVLRGPHANVVLAQGTTTFWVEG